MTRILLTAAALPLAAVLCTGAKCGAPVPLRDVSFGADADRDVASGLGYDPNACAAVVVPNRFGFRWTRINHRVSKWAVELAETPEGGCRPTEYRTEVVGGTFSQGTPERPLLKFGFRDRVADDPRELGAARRRLDIDIPPGGVARGTRTFDRDDLELEGYPHAWAVIEGFRFDTEFAQGEAYPDDYNPAQGYTLRGIGASVGVADVSGATITLSYRFRFEPGTSPDRDNLNHAVAHARIDGRLDVLLFGSSNPAHAGSVRYTTSYPEPEIGTDDEERFKPPSPKKRRLVLRGRPGAPAGLFGISSFNFELIPRIDCNGIHDCAKGESCRSDGTCTSERGEPGFYIRELTVDLQMTSYNRTAGEAVFSFLGYASNSTEAIGFWPLTSRFSGALQWMQTAGASSSVRYETEFETGTHTVPLLEMPN